MIKSVIFAIAGVFAGRPEGVAEEDLIIGAGYYWDDDGNMRRTSDRMSDGRYDHLG